MGINNDMSNNLKSTQNYFLKNYGNDSNSFSSFNIRKIDTDNYYMGNQHLNNNNIANNNNARKPKKIFELQNNNNFNISNDNQNTQNIQNNQKK